MMRRGFAASASERWQQHVRHAHGSVTEREPARQPEPQSLSAAGAGGAPRRAEAALRHEPHPPAWAGAPGGPAKPFAGLFTSPRDVEGKLAQALSWAVTLAGILFVLSLIPILLVVPSMASHALSISILATAAGTILFGGVVFFATHSSHENLNFHLRSQHDEDLSSGALIKELGLQIDNAPYYRAAEEIAQLQIDIARLRYSHKVSVERLNAIFE